MAKKKLSSSNTNTILLVYLKEYETLRLESERRLATEGQIQFYAIAALGGLIPLIQYVESIEKTGGNAYFLLLIASVIFTAFSWHEIEMENGVAEINLYFKTVLIPRIRELMSEERLFDWEVKALNRKPTFSDIWIVLGNLGKLGIAPTISFGLLIYYVYFQIFVKNIWVTWELSLATLIFFSVIWTATSGLMIRKKYTKSFDERYNNKW